MSSVGIVSKSQSFQYIQANPQSGVKPDISPKIQPLTQPTSPNQVSQSKPVKHESLGRLLDTYAYARSQRDNFK